MNVISSINSSNTIKQAVLRRKW